MGGTQPWEVGREGQGTPVDSAFLKFQPFLGPSGQGHLSRCLTLP